MKLFQVDAFTDELFAGNPAAVCPLEQWISADVMQKIAAENNLSETAFFVKQADGAYHIRWFTPTAEVDLCGHATLATAHVLFAHLGHCEDSVRFHSASGPLRVNRMGDFLQLDFPRQDPQLSKMPEYLVEGLGMTPGAVLRHQDYIAVLNNAADIATMAPDFRTLSRIETRGICVTARGEDCDFVCRFFAPAWGIDEDPVTGSAYCELAPFWAEQLGKTRMTARQLSTRGGIVQCELQKDRVLIGGQARTYLIGDIPDM